MSADATHGSPGSGHHPTTKAAAPPGALTWIAHQGGPRNGTVAELPTAVLAGYLVYDGPHWFGVYQPADPPCTVSTPHGPAQVRVAIDG